MTMTDSYWIQTLYDETHEFNEIAGNNVKFDKDALKAQLKLIKEEVQELDDAINIDNSPVDMLDAVIDTYVVLNGFASKLVALGFDMRRAADRTAENNLSKFPDNEQVAINTVKSLKEQGVDAVYEYDSRYDAYRIIDSNGKIRKPVGFTSNDLSDLVPTGYKIS